MAIGLTFPLAKTTSSIGYLDATHDQLSAAENNLKSLIFTNWGERPCHFYLGCNLREFLFENSKEEVKAKIADRILSQVDKWLPFISIDNLNIIDNLDDKSVPENSFELLIEFSLKQNPDLSSRFQVLYT